MLQIKGQLEAKHARLPVTLVIDNHTAHRAADNLNYEGFNVLFTPAYSSYFNSQETVWNQVRRSLFKHFARFEPELKAQVSLVNEVQQVLDKFSKDYNNKDFFLAARDEL